MNNEQKSREQVDGDAVHPAISLKNGSKTFVGNTVLKAVDLDIRAGEIHALMGENGAGKSTLIKILAGLHRPDDGAVLSVNGREVSFREPGEAIDAGISTVHQELLLFPELTIAENIFLGNYPRRKSGFIDWSRANSMARHWLDELDAGELDPGTKIAELSVAQRQRVEIARALSRDAKVLILDEPTAALGEKDAMRLLELVKALRARGVAILYVSHRMSEIFQISDRLSVLRDGAMVGTRNVEEVSEGDIVSMMVGRSIDQVFPKTVSNIGEEIFKVTHLNRGRMVNNINFSLRKGEILGIAGLVGSGRSELAHVLFGLTPAQSGEIYLKGEPVKITSPAQARDLGIAYVPEDRAQQGLVREFDIKSNISLASLAKISRKKFIDTQKEKEIAKADISRFGIRANGGPDQIVARLSGGNQQKVVLAKWLETNPDILILDEPTRGVDIGAKSEIHKMMGELVQQGLSIIMISSELPEVLGMSDRVMVINTGQVAGTFDRENFNAEILGQAMTGDINQTEKATEAAI